VTADQPDAPPYFTYDAVLNSKERPTLDETLARELNPMTLDQVLALQSVGGQLLDTRDPVEFAAAHLQGSINIGLGGQYATWAGTILSRERPIVIIADPGREGESAVRLGRIGFDHVVGYLKDGLHSIGSRTDLTATTERVSAPVAAERVAHDEAILVDVRAPASGDRSTSPEASRCRSTTSRSARRNCRAIAPCWFTAPAATARRLRPAFCSALASSGSARWRVVWRRGRQRSSR
jgi:hydroxyacylglutathione hydrolase